MILLLKRNSEQRERLETKVQVNVTEKKMHTVQKKARWKDSEHPAQQFACLILLESKGS